MNTSPIDPNKSTSCTIATQNAKQSAEEQHLLHSTISSKLPMNPSDNPTSFLKYGDNSDPLIHRHVNKRQKINAQISPQHPAPIPPSISDDTLQTSGTTPVACNSAMHDELLIDGVQKTTPNIPPPQPGKHQGGTALVQLSQGDEQVSQTDGRISASSEGQSIQPPTPLPTTIPSSLQVQRAFLTASQSSVQNDHAFNAKKRKADVLDHSTDQRSISCSPQTHHSPAIVSSSLLRKKKEPQPLASFSLISPVSSLSATQPILAHQLNNPALSSLNNQPKQHILDPLPSLGKSLVPLELASPLNDPFDDPITPLSTSTITFKQPITPHITNATPPLQALNTALLYPSDQATINSIISILSPINTQFVSARKSSSKQPDIPPPPSSSHLSSLITPISADFGPTKHPQSTESKSTSTTNPSSHVNNLGTYPQQTLFSPNPPHLSIQPNNSTTKTTTPSSHHSNTSTILSSTHPQNLPTLSQPFHCKFPFSPTQQHILRPNSLSNASSGRHHLESINESISHVDGPASDSFVTKQPYNNEHEKLTNKSLNFPYPLHDQLHLSHIPLSLSATVLSPSRNVKSNQLTQNNNISSSSNHTIAHHTVLRSNEVVNTTNYSSDGALHDLNASIHSDSTNAHHHNHSNYMRFNHNHNHMNDHSHLVTTPRSQVFSTGDQPANQSIRSLALPTLPDTSTRKDHKTSVFSASTHTTLITSTPIDSTHINIHNQPQRQNVQQFDSINSKPDPRSIATPSHRTVIAQQFHQSVQHENGLKHNHDTFPPINSLTYDKITPHTPQHIQTLSSSASVGLFKPNQLITSHAIPDFPQTPSQFFVHHSGQQQLHRQYQPHRQHQAVGKNGASARDHSATNTTTANTEPILQHYQQARHSQPHHHQHSQLQHQLRGSTQPTPFNSHSTSAMKSTPSIPLPIVQTLPINHTDGVIGANSNLNTSSTTQTVTPSTALLPAHSHSTASSIPTRSSFPPMTITSTEPIYDPLSSLTTFPLLHPTHPPQNPFDESPEMMEYYDLKRMEALQLISQQVPHSLHSGPNHTSDNTWHQQPHYTSHESTFLDNDDHANARRHGNSRRSSNLTHFVALQPNQAHQMPPPQLPTNFVDNYESSIDDHEEEEEEQQQREQEQGLTTQTYTTASGRVTQIPQSNNAALQQHRTRLPLTATLALRRWFLDNLCYPYLTASEKQRLAVELSLSQTQVGNWINNCRKRIYLPLLRQYRIDVVFGSTPPPAIRDKILQLRQQLPEEAFVGLL